MDRSTFSIPPLFSPTPSSSPPPPEFLPDEASSIPLPISSKRNPAPNSVTRNASSDNYLSDIGMDLDISIGRHPVNAFQKKKNTVRDAMLNSENTSSSLSYVNQPQNPSSPPRKRSKGGKRKYTDIGTGRILDLDEDNWARFFIIKKKNGTFSNDCSFKMSRFLKNLIGKAKSVKKLGDGSLCIEAGNRTQAEAVLAMTKLQDCDVEAGPHKRLNTSQGVITCRDFLNSTIDDIREGLAEEGVIEVRRIKRRQGDTLIDTASLVLTFDKPKPPVMIEAAFYKLKVRPYIPSPMRCFKCQKFGHTSQRCKAIEQICVCGKSSHEGECTPPITCVNCGGDHSARSAECPILKEEKEIQRLKTLQQLSYPEARTIVKSKSYVTSDTTFAQKVKKTIFEFSAAPNNSEGQAKSSATPALKGKIIKVGEIPPPKFSAPAGASEAVRLLKTPLSASSGENSKVGSLPPSKVALSEGDWQVVGPPRRSSRRTDTKVSTPRPPRTRGNKLKPTAGEPKPSSSSGLRRSPRPKWKMTGTDVEASESDGGSTSDRPPTRKKGLSKILPRKATTE